MGAEEGERLSWLLKPIRDLNENWNIQLAEELEKYHEEVNIIDALRNESPTLIEAKKENIITVVL